MNLVQGKCLLKKLIKARSMTQRMFSIRTGVNENVVSFYCVGRREQMSLSLAVRFADALGCSPRDLYEWEYDDSEMVDNYGGVEQGTDIELKETDHVQSQSRPLHVPRGPGLSGGAGCSERNETEL